MRLKTAVAATLLALTCAPAWSAGHFYILGSGGMTRAADLNASDLDADLTAAGFNVLSSSTDKSDTGYKLQLGYQFNPNFAIEGGYTYLGRFKYSANLTGGSAVADAEADGWNLAVVGMMPLANNFGLLGKIGMIDSKVDLRVSAAGPGGTASGSEGSHKWKNYWGLGGTYNVSQNLGIRLEYEEFHNLGEKDKTGESDVSMWSVGLSWRF